MEQMHILDLLIGLDVGAQTPTPSAGDIILAYTQLADGELAVVNEFNEVQDATTVLTDPYVEQRGIRIVGRKGTELMFSDFIHVDDLISYTGILDSATVQQVTHIGYVGSGSMSLDVINDNVYSIHINIKEKDRTGFGRNEIIDVMYRSDASATQTEVAFGLLENLRASLATKPELLICAQLLNSAAVVAGNGFDSNFAVVNGNEYITSAGANCNYGGNALAVGDLVRLGTVGGGTALTNNVYKVVELTSATVCKLDRPVADASGNYAAATADAEVIPAASIANYGIQLTGQALTHIPGKRPYSVVMFDVGIQGFTGTQVTYSTAPVIGSGNPDQIKDLEYFTHGNRGDRYRYDYMHAGYTSQVADSGEMYDQLNITWNAPGRSEGIDGPRHNPKQLVIALVTGFSNEEAPDILVDILDAYFGISSGVGV